MTFGERLRQHREAAGLTQEQVAHAIGVAKSTVTGYEKDHREPDVIKIAKLAQLLNVSGDELIGIEKPAPERWELDDKEKGLIVSFRACEPEDQSAILHIVSRLSPQPIAQSPRLTKEEAIASALAQLEAMYGSQREHRESGVK